MIRINLLPQSRRKTQRHGSQGWLVVLLLVLIGQVGGLFYFHSTQEEVLRKQRQKNAELTSQIDQSKKAVANHAEIKAKLDRLRAREEAISKLQSARTGPTAMLLELARLVTPGRGPTVSQEELDKLRRDNPLAVFNASWDPRRLWLTKFVEERRKVRLEGMARDGEDVSELARRMNLSSQFTDVRLLPAKKVRDDRTGVELVSFQLEATARY